MKLNLNIEKVAKLTRKGKFKLILRIYNRFKNTKTKLVNKRSFFPGFLKRLKKSYPILFKKVSKKKIIYYLQNKTQWKKKNLKSTFKKDFKLLTKRFRKLLFNFSNIINYNKAKSKIQRRVKAMNRLVKRKKINANLSKRTFFFRIIRKKRRRRLKVFRLNRKKPIFTKKTKKEKKFLFKSRESLLKTKKFLYRKKFPKIKGKKNKNFNFFFYNNMDRAPFKFNIGRIIITYLLNNTFINIHNSKKMLKVISAGKLGFKGPKRSTQYSRQIVARKAINFVARSQMNVLDIFLNSNYNRWYYFLFKEISKPKVKPYVIRYLVISNSRPHGFIRDKKHRRK